MADTPTALAWRLRIQRSLYIRPNQRRLAHTGIQVVHTKKVTCDVVGEGWLTRGGAEHDLGYFRHHRAIARTTAGMSLRSARQSAMTAGTARARAAAVTTTRIRDTGTPPLRGLGSVVNAMVANGSDSLSLLYVIR
jgi:hypothetical protein